MELNVAASPPKITRNPEASRARILDAARLEFVSHGLSGGRVDRIAKQSGVNKNLIYHYFGSKDALYLTVLERIYADLRTRQQDQDLRGLPPVEGMKRLVANTFDHFADTPDLIRLMSIENIHYAEHLKRSAVTKALYGGLLDTIRMLLKRGQDEGVFRANVDAVDLYLSISGLAYFFLSNQHTLSWLLDRDLAARRRVLKRRRHVVEMVLGYLTQTSPEDAEGADAEMIKPEIGK
jgi:TetR/AcrR family transcriptional regulator